MKILIVTNVATKGSVGGIITILKEGLIGQGNEVIICYGYYNDNPQEVVYRRICSKLEFWVSAFLTRLTGLEGFFNYLSLKRVVKEIKAFKPDIVQIANLHAYYMNEYGLLNYLKRNNIPTVYSMFDSYAFTGKCPFPISCERYNNGCGKCKQIKQYPKSSLFDMSPFLFRKKREAYDGFENLHFVGGIGIYRLAKESLLLKGRKIHLIDEPQKLEKVFFPKNTVNLKKKLGIPLNNKVVLAAIPLEKDSERKRGYYFLDVYNKMQDRQGYSFVYIGFDTTKYGNPSDMIKIPYLESPDEFATYLSLGDILFFTSVADTTPCTVIDALACGTPVVGFDIEGLTCFNINDKRVMKIVEIGDIDSVVEIIDKTPRKDKEIISACRGSVVESFESTNVVSKYMDLYRTISVNR